MVASSLSERGSDGGSAPGKGELTRTMTGPNEDQFSYLGRRFVLTCEGPIDNRRYEVFIRELPSGRLLTRAPVRGRSPEDAKDRAVEVIHTMLGIERLQDAIVAIAAELAPGTTVELTEDAQAIRAEVSGDWELTAPLAVPRDVITDPDLDFETLRDQVRVHFITHLKAARDC